MALSDYYVPVGNRTNICFDCQKATGGCSWSELDPETGKPRFALPPGAEATPSTLDGQKRMPVHTYHITACPEFLADEPRVTDNLELLPGMFLRG